jgi:hypothetical protein
MSPTVYFGGGGGGGGGCGGGDKEGGGGGGGGIHVLVMYLYLVCVPCVGVARVCV